MVDRDVLDERRLRRLIDVGRGLVAQLDLEAVLREVVEVARELTGARYAALGGWGALFASPSPSAPQKLPHLRSVATGDRARLVPSPGARGSQL